VEKMGIGEKTKNRISSGARGVDSDEVFCSRGGVGGRGEEWLGFLGKDFCRQSHRPQETGRKDS